MSGAVVKNLPANTGHQCRGLEKEVATPSSILAWRIPGTGEPGGLQSQGRGSLVGYSPRDRGASWATVPGTGEPGGLQSMGL